MKSSTVEREVVVLETRVRFPASTPDRRLYEVHLGQSLVAFGWIRDGLSDVQLVPPGSLRVRLLDESGSVIATKEIEATVGREALVVIGG